MKIFETLRNYFGLPSAPKKESGEDFEKLELIGQQAKRWVEDRERKEKKRLDRKRRQHKSARVAMPNEDGHYQPKPVRSAAMVRRKNAKLAWVNSMELCEPKLNPATGLVEHRRRETQCPRKLAVYLETMKAN